MYHFYAWVTHSYSLDLQKMSHNLLWDCFSPLYCACCVYLSRKRNHMDPKKQKTREAARHTEGMWGTWHFIKYPLQHTAEIHPVHDSLILSLTCIISPSTGATLIIPSHLYEVEEPQTLPCKSKHLCKHIRRREEELVPYCESCSSGYIGVAWEWDPADVHGCKAFRRHWSNTDWQNTGGQTPGQSRSWY